MSKQKKTIIAVLAVAVLAIAMAAVYFLTRPQTAQGTKNFRVEVVHGDGSSMVYNYSADAGYLGEALQITGLIQGENNQFGLYVTTVDGERAVYEENGAYWALFVDGEYAQQGIDQTPVTDGGSYSLVYTVG